MDSSEQFLEVGLDDHRVGGLAKNLKQIIVTDEVKARENGTFFL
jgi:hypothetical protein